MLNKTTLNFILKAFPFKKEGLGLFYIFWLNLTVTNVKAQIFISNNIDLPIVGLQHVYEKTKHDEAHTLYIEHKDNLYIAPNTVFFVAGKIQIDTTLFDSKKGLCAITNNVKPVQKLNKRNIVQYLKKDAITVNNDPDNNNIPIKFPWENFPQKKESSFIFNLVSTTATHKLEYKTFEALRGTFLIYPSIYEFSVVTIKLFIYNNGTVSDNFNNNYLSRPPPNIRA